MYLHKDNTSSYECFSSWLFHAVTSLSLAYCICKMFRSVLLFPVTYSCFLVKSALYFSDFFWCVKPTLSPRPQILMRVLFGEDWDSVVHAYSCFSLRKSTIFSTKVLADDLLNNRNVYFSNQISCLYNSPKHATVCENSGGTSRLRLSPHILKLPTIVILTRTYSLQFPIPSHAMMSLLRFVSLFISCHVGHGPQLRSWQQHSNHQHCQQHTGGAPRWCIIFCFVFRLGDDGPTNQRESGWVTNVCAADARKTSASVRLLANTTRRAPARESAKGGAVRAAQPLAGLSQPFSRAR